MQKDILQTQGRIFDIQRYSIHDGPGIRTIVFLKGCALRCRWCCNPESQSFEIQHMNFNGKDEIMGYDVTVGEVLQNVQKDMFFYRRSGGGLTLSGGEAMLQPEFAIDLLKACHRNGINTCIETTGIASWEVIEKFLEHLDYVLMDIKHMDNNKHKEFTLQPNIKILDHATKIAAAGANLTIRTPVIPGFNDTIEEIQDIAQFTAALPGKPHLHLLPYHRLGEDKYSGLNRDYYFKGIPPMDMNKMNILLDTAKKCGVECQIGG